METRPVQELKPHPLNTEIYGNTPDGGMVASVRKTGVIEPLVITRGNVIVSGHRRWRAAQAAGLTVVPVTLFHSEDDLVIIEALVEANRQRVKTEEQLAKEAKALKDVEAERAKRRRQEAGSVAGKVSGASRRGGPNLPVAQPEGSDAGDARDKAGEALGISGSKVDKLIAVVEAIEDLEEQGEQAEAETLRTVLNEEGAEPAHRMAKENGYVPNKKGGSDRTKKRLARIKRDAIPEIYEMVERGELAAEPADRIARKPKAEQQRLAAQGAAKIKEEMNREKRSEDAKYPSRNGQGKGKGNKEEANVVEALRWAARKKRVTKEELADRFGLTHTTWGRVLSNLSKGTGFLVREADDGEHEVRKAVHFIWKDQEEESPDLQSVLKRLYDLAVEANRKECSGTSVTWTHAERITFLSEVMGLLGNLVGR